MATKTAVFIARVQPPHNAHVAIARHALSKYDRLIVCIGSAKQARSPKNPFNAAERTALFQSALTEDELSRTAFIPIRDYMYNENLWITDVQRKVKQAVGADGGPISICGRLKDRSTYYMRLFPQWTCDEYGFEHPFDATKIRKALIDGDLKFVEGCTPAPVFERMMDWRTTDDFRRILEEQRFYEDYRSRFRFVGAENVLPIHQTADAVVEQAGHVLLVRRRTRPGKGLLALPGGFVNQYETVEQSALRELKEETGIQVPKHVLQKHIVGSRKFDHPDRSLRGRIITEAYHIKLDPVAADDYDLPAVKGDDDAEDAFWVPLVELPELEEQFFEDHIHIIRYFTARS